MSTDSMDCKPVTVELFEKYSYSQKMFAFDSNKIKKDEKTADQTSKKLKKIQLLLERQSDFLSFDEHAMFYAFVYRKKRSGELDEQRKKLLLKMSRKIIEEQKTFIKHLSKEDLPKQFEVKEEILKYVNEMLEFEWKKVLDYPRYYTVRDVVPLLCAGETTKPVFFHMLTPLEMGRIPYLIVPTKTIATLRINQNYHKLFQRFPSKPPPNNGRILYRTPIKDDANARNLALKFGASTLLTSGCLQVLFATTDSCLGTSWEIPISIEEVSDGADKTVKLIFIEKPFKQRNMPLLERNLLFYKRSLKLGVTHPRHGKSHHFNKGDSPLQKKQCFTRYKQKAPLVKKPDAKDDVKQPTSGEPDYSRTNDNVFYDLMDGIDINEEFGDSDSDGLVIDLDEKKCKGLESDSDDEMVIDLGDADESFSSLETNESKSDIPDNASVSGRTSANSNTEISDATSVDAEVNNESSGTKADDHENPILRRSTRLNKKTAQEESPDTSLETIDELQNQTLGGTTEFESSLLTENKKVCENDIKLEDFIPPKEGHNVRYELWRIGDVNVLVRCTVDGVTYDDQKPVLNKVVPKMEYKSSYGGERTTPVECAKQWISTTIIPNSKLLRVRIDAFTSMVVGAQYLNVNQVVAPKVDFNPYNYISNLSNILAKLTLLPVGCYIISHSAGEGVFKIMQQVETETAEPPLNKDCYDLHSCYTTTCKEDFDNVDTIPWIPVDPNVILFKHEKYELIPSTFIPKGRPVSKAGRLKLANNEWLVKRRVRKTPVPTQEATNIKKRKGRGKLQTRKKLNNKAQSKKTT